MRTITPAYPTYDQALRRAETLQREHGIWPGIAGPNPDGRYQLTYDPHLEHPENETP